MHQCIHFIEDAIEDGRFAGFFSAYALMHSYLSLFESLSQAEFKRKEAEVVSVHLFHLNRRQDRRPGQWRT